MTQASAVLVPARAIDADPPSAPGAGGLTAEFRADLSLPPLDEQALDRLADVRPETGVFLSCAWLSGYFDEPPERATCGLLLLRDRGALRAAVPLALRETLTHVQVGILGGDLFSDRVDLLSARGYDPASGDALLRWLHETFGRRGFALELRGVSCTSPIWGAIHRSGAASSRQLALLPREVHPHPYLPLVGEDGRPDERWRQWSAPLGKHRRWLERRGPVRIERVLDPPQITDAFDHLVRFLRERWQGRGPGSALDDPRAVRFHRRVLPRLQAAGRLRMKRITVGDRIVAVFYGLAAGTWHGYYLAGYDREWAGRIHLGRLNLDAAIAAAAAEGATEFDFLKGAEPVKYTWPVVERTTVDADVFSRRCGVHLTRAARAARDAGAALVTSARAILAD
jgi:CelD/BcsL family acetyltransferase involved in cellulose biosynthesis